MVIHTERELIMLAFRVYVYLDEDVRFDVIFSLLQLRIHDHDAWEAK